MNQHQIELFSSKKSDDWATPQWLYKELDNEFHFNLDPCPLNSQIDGLKMPWEGNVFEDRITDLNNALINQLETGKQKTIYINQLEKENENLRCCGNCKLDRTPECMKKDEWTVGNEYCDNWQPDGLTKTGRSEMK